MSKTKHTFEEDLKRLQEIVEEMESGPDIETAMELYEEGQKLSLLLEARLSDIERKVYRVRNIEEINSGEEEDLDLSLFE